MRLYFRFAFMALFCLWYSQGHGQWELNPCLRYDRYPEFSYNVAERPNTDFLTLSGTSLGLNIGYKIPVGNQLLLKPSIGYLKWSYNSVKNYNSAFGRSNSRLIKYPSPLLYPFRTDKYGYHTVAANLALEKVFEHKHRAHIHTGLQVNNYFTFSQYYHIDYDNPDNPIDNPYRTNRNAYFGLSTSVYVVYLASVGGLTVGPQLIIPVFDMSAVDDIFMGESAKGYRTKWLHGIGVGLSFNWAFKSKK